MVIGWLIADRSDERCAIVLPLFEERDALSFASLHEANPELIGSLSWLHCWTFRPFLPRATARLGVARKQ
jgi:hypothetical protein